MVKKKFKTNDNRHKEAWNVYVFIKKLITHYMLSNIYYNSECHIP